MTSQYSLKEQILRAFLVDQSLGPSEMAEKLGAKYNSVKAAFAKLCDEGMLKRVSRGKYAPDIPRILLNLMDRITVLEERGR